MEITFIVRGEEVVLLDVNPEKNGRDMDVPLPRIGTCNTVHMEFVAQEILKAIAKSRGEKK